MPPSQAGQHFLGRTNAQAREQPQANEVLEYFSRSAAQWADLPESAAI